MTESFSVLEIFKKAYKYLEEKGVESYKSDTEWIFSDVLKIKKIEIYLDAHKIKNNEHLKELRKKIIRRGKREPLQHIIGSVDFHDCKIKSDKRALIPRFETEKLVELIIDKLPKGFSGSIVDLGTGTGAIIIALAKFYPNSNCIGFDKSENALTLAQENIKLNNCSRNVQLRKFDWNKEPYNFKKSDVLISNPPYLTLEDWNNAEPEVRIYDPKEALIAKKEGISELEAILKLSKSIVKKNGLVAMEFGRGQSEVLKNKFQYLFNEFCIEKDLAGIRRFLIGTTKN